MAKKPNPILAQYEAKLNAVYMQKLQINSELDMMALLIAANDELQVGPGRAGNLLNSFLATKVEIADAILQDSADDKSISHTKADLAGRLREILGPEGWKKYRAMLVLLADYWE